MGSGQAKDGGQTPSSQRIPQPPASGKSSTKRKREKGDAGKQFTSIAPDNATAPSSETHSQTQHHVPHSPSPAAAAVQQSRNQPVAGGANLDDIVKKQSIAPNQYGYLLAGAAAGGGSGGAVNGAHHQVAAPAAAAGGGGVVAQQQQQLQQQLMQGGGGASAQQANAAMPSISADEIGKRATFRQVVKRSVELAKEQRERFGKFRKDEKRAVMELYEILGLDEDVFLAPPNDLQKRLSNYRFPPTNMHMLRDIDVIDEDTMEFILGTEEAKLRRSEGLEVLPRERKATSDNQRRAGVSSEATRMLKMKVFKEIPKTKEQTERLTVAMQHNMLFKGLDKRDIKTLFDAFEQESFEAETTIFEQGDEGDKFYLVDSGRCQIIIKDDKGAELHSLFVGSGDTFGELALMYGTPRAATVTTVLDTVCWWIDRETYRGTLLNQTVKKRDRYLAFLESVPILSSMDSYEKARMADVLEVVDFPRGHAVVREGESGDAFYIIEEGEVKVEMASRSGEVTRLGPGKFFGEMALLFDRPRLATVTVLSPYARFVMLNRVNFTNYLGPLDEILRRNADQYKHFIGMAAQQ